MFSAHDNPMTSDERQSKVMSGMIPAGKLLHEDFDASLDRGNFSQLTLMRIDNSLRQTWSDLFDPQVKMHVSENHESLSAIFSSYGDLRLDELSIYKRVDIDKDAAAASFKEFITGKPFEFALGMRCLLYSGKKAGNLGFMTALMGRDEDYFVVPIMNSGFYLGAETSALLKRNDKFAGAAFVGYSAGVYPHRNHRYLLRDGSCLEGKTLVTQKDKELIDQNKNKPMLIVDDLIATGETTAKVEEMLRKEHGVKEIYKIVNDYSCLYL